VNQRGLPWKKICQVFSQLAFKTAEKNHVGIGGGFDLKFVHFPLGLSGRFVSACAYTNFKPNLHQLQYGLSPPFPNWLKI
jgi:hypothetical protein